MAGKGGARPGAGRPKGSAGINRRGNTRRAVARLARDQGKLPLEVMVSLMGEYEKLAKKAETEEERLAYRELAFEKAVGAAPYLHARLSSVEAKVEVEQAKTLSDSALDGELVGLLHAIKQEQPDDDAQRAPVH